MADDHASQTPAADHGGQDGTPSGDGQPQHAPTPGRQPSGEQAPAWQQPEWRQPETSPPPAWQQVAQPGHQQAADQEPTYRQPVYQQPFYEQPGYPPTVYPPSAYPPVGYPPTVYQAPETEPLAIFALVASIGTLFIVPVIGQIVALILASMAKKNIRASGGRLTGEGLATAAQVISWLVLVPAILAVLFLILLFLGLASLGL